jgi:hypothetical protein
MRYEIGSHHRGFLPHHRYDPADPDSSITNDIIWDRVQSCPLDIGGAVLHWPNTLHAAYPNSTAGVRRVWALLFRPLGRYGFLAPSRLLKQAQELRMAIWPVSLPSVHHE